MMLRRLPQAVTALMLALWTGACASSGAVPRPFPGAPVPASGTGGGKAEAPKPKPTDVARLPGTVKPAPGNPGSRGGSAAPAPPAPPAHTDGYAVTSTALGLRGVPYRDGGVDPATGFDCSGFTQYVFHEHGVSLPREVRDQYETGKKVKPEDLKVGDLIFFTTTAPGPTHVAIAIGGDQFIHAPSSTGVVRIERLNSAYWSKRFLTIRRVL